MLTLFLRFVFLTLAFAPPHLSKVFAEPGGSCRPELNFHQGWLGADGGSSVSLGDGRSLWLFGDTFIGREGALDRAQTTLIANSIGIARCTPAGFTIDYAWKKSGSTAQAFFPSKDGLDFWPVSAILVDGLLQIILIAVDKHPAQANGLGFVIKGTSLATIKDWHKDPEAWTLDIQDFLRDDRVIAGVSLLAHESELLLYSSYASAAGQPGILMRCPYHDLRECRPDLLLTKGWIPFAKADLGQAKILLDGAATEFSVTRHGSEYLWVHNSLAAGFPAQGVWLSRAAHPEGPFGPPALLASFPQGTDLKSSQIFCYASKEHRELSGEQNLQISFACNSFDFFGELLRNLRVYTLWTLSYDLEGQKAELFAPQP